MEVGSFDVGLRFFFFGGVGEDLFSLFFYFEEMKIRQFYELFGDFCIKCYKLYFQSGSFEVGLLVNYQIFGGECFMWSVLWMFFSDVDQFFDCGGLNYVFLKFTFKF